MEALEKLIHDLDKINNEILFSIDGEDLEIKRTNHIAEINDHCKIITSNLDKNDKDQFINLIKKYLTIQEDYRDKKRGQFVTQLLIRNPNLTTPQMVAILNYGTANKNVLCLESIDFHNYVTDRHNSILKLERDIAEINELFIGTYALVTLQGEKIDKIGTHVGNAKNDCQEAKEDFVVAYKTKNRCILF
jgi:t-SNARE complex subunit (syntaxin)